MSRRRLRYHWWAWVSDKVDVDEAQQAVLSASCNVGSLVNIVSLTTVRAQSQVRKSHKLSCARGRGSFGKSHNLQCRASSAVAEQQGSFQKLGKVSFLCMLKVYYFLMAVYTLPFLHGCSLCEAFSRQFFHHLAMVCMGCKAHHMQSEYGLQVPFRMRLFGGENTVGWELYRFCSVLYPHWGEAVQCLCGRILSKLF